MTKFVNLDELAAAPRTIRYKGEEHPVEDLPLEKFIKFQDDFEKMLEAQDKNDAASVLNLAESIIGMCVPTFVQHVRSLNLRQLLACVQLIADVYPSPEEADVPAAQEPAPDAEGNA